MRNPFRSVAGGIEVTIGSAETNVLEAIPGLLESVGLPEEDPAARRLDQSPYPDDPQADAEFRRLMSGEMMQSRSADRSAFALTVEQVARGVTLSAGESEAWLRVLAEARLVLATRVGITDDGWEEELSDDDPTVAVLHYLGWLQQSLAEVLSNRVD